MSTGFADIEKFLKLIPHLFFAFFVEQEMAKTVAKLSEEGKVRAHLFTHLIFFSQIFMILLPFIFTLGFSVVLL
jgi:hypothetical protein